MQYKGHELEPLTERKVWDEPHKMLCWDEDTEEPEIREVVAHFPEITDVYHVVCFDGGWFVKCAEIPEEPKPRRATNRELSRWLAQGNGEIIQPHCISQHFSYCPGEENETVENHYEVRNWADTEWHEPTVDYMGLEE